jgi:hypothetical protein
MESACPHFATLPRYLPEEPDYSWVLAGIPQNDTSAIAALSRAILIDGIVEIHRRGSPLVCPSLSRQPFSPTHRKSSEFQNALCGTGNPSDLLRVRLIRIDSIRTRVNDQTSRLILGPIRSSLLQSRASRK